jgi:pimeloyl-ACP methyl ester carboxylesterase
VHARPATRSLAALLGALLLSLGLSASTASASPPLVDRVPECAHRTSWLAGSTELCAGTLVYRDYVFDDYGADDGGTNTASTADLSPTAGEGRYPAGDVNTADLVRLSLWMAGGRLQVEAELNALFHPHSTVLAVAIDTDHKANTGGGAWGDLPVSSAGWDVLAHFDRGNVKTNLIRGSLPLPNGSRWRVQAVTAQRATKEVMNVAFRGVDEQARWPTGNAADSSEGSWFEDRQAAALGDGDISMFGYDVSVADLRGGVTRPAPAASPGLHERVYTSAYTLPPGEGMTYDGVPGRGDGGTGPVKPGFEQGFNYLGRYQPYGIYIPHTPGPWGLQFVFHGTSANHSSLINAPGMQTEFGENLDRVLVVPEVRGPDGYVSDISERDVLDVWADVERIFSIDRDREFTGGYSQGGYMSFRMAMLYPDRFAGAVSWVGFTGDEENGLPVKGVAHYTAGGVGNVIDFVGNLRSVPTVMLNSGEDYLVHIWTALAMDRAFAASDNLYTWYLYPAGEHLTFALIDDFSQEASDTAALRRVRNPARVTFRTAEFLGSPKYGIRHDRAYWVSGIRGRNDGYIDVDLETQACGSPAPATETGNFAGVATLPWVSDYRRPAGNIVGLRMRQMKLTGSLGNVASLVVDARATCLSGRTLAYDVMTDGPATIRLTDGRLLKLDSSGRQRGSLPAP